MLQHAGQKRPLSPGFPAEGGQPSGRARPATIALGLAAAAALTLAGCGTAPPPPGKGQAVTTAGRPELRARADAYARHALRDLRLPPGARQVMTPLPAIVRQSGLVAMPRGTTADLSQVYRVALPPAAVRAFLSRHVPIGWRAGEAGQAGRVGGRMTYWRNFSPARTPNWAYSVIMGTGAVAAAHGGSLLRVEVQVVWFPPRSAAEHIDPARYRAVIVIVPKPGTMKPVRLSRTFTGRRIVARLAALVNDLPASPDIAVPCPLMMAGRFARLVFLPRAGAQEIVVTMPGCISATVRVGGQPQPALYPIGPLAAVMSRLLGVAPAG